MKNIPYSHQSIDRQDIQAVVNVLRSDWITQGPRIKEFEAALCAYTGAKYAVAVTSGTAALHIAALAAGFTRGDEVIVPANTFVATSNAVIYAGAKPVFADIETTTGNASIDSINKLLSAKTKGIIAVDFAGMPCDWEQLRKKASAKKLILIDDASHSLGGSYLAGGKWHKVGCCQHADMSTLSFHPLKSITMGEGGAVLTNRRDLYERLSLLRNQGITKDKANFIPLAGRLASEEYLFQMISIGFNYRITDIQCALGISQLKKVDDFIKKRTLTADYYQKAFKGNPFFDTLTLPKPNRSAHHLFPILLKKAGQKFKVLEAFRERGLGVQTHYMPVYWHPYYQNLGYKACYAPNAEDFYRREISIPIYPALSGKDRDYVVKTILDVCDEQ